MTDLRIFSFGGGVQSTAVLALVAQGELHYDALLFANVGEDSENPETLQYVRDVAMPFANQHGIRLEEVRWVDRLGRVRELLADVLRLPRTLTIPVRFQTRAGKRARLRRSCTAAYKIKPISRWLRRAGATAEHPATVGLGISTDEFQRAKTRLSPDWEVPEYPLLDLRLSRADCKRLIAAAGLPVPPRSSCWFCPFKRPASWAELKRGRPDLFARAVELERTLDARGEQWQFRPVRLTDSLLPLDQLIVGDQLTLDDALDACDSGHCWT